MSRKKAGDYGNIEFAIEVIESMNRPLSTQEIWDCSSEEQKERLKKNSKALSILSSLNSSITNEANKDDHAKIKGFGRNPVKWGLASWKNDNSESVLDTLSNDIIEEDDDNDSQTSGKKASYCERDLHKLLVSYVGYDPYFSACYCKTLFHEASTKQKSGKNLWIHPDIVGVSYPFEGKTGGGYRKDTLEFMKRFEHTECRLYSFEMKKIVKSAQLRENFFQAVSNSSWAHEGYLVALKFENGLEDEMKMLSESFGIGFIELDCKDYKNSRICFPAKRKESLDWNMIDRLYNSNPGFRQFVTSIESDLGSSRITNEKNFDPKFETDNEFKKYIKAHNITKDE